MAIRLRVSKLEEKAQRAEAVKFLDWAVGVLRKGGPVAEKVRETLASELGYNDESYLVQRAREIERMGPEEVRARSEELMDKLDARRKRREDAERRRRPNEG